MEWKLQVKGLKYTAAGTCPGISPGSYATGEYTAEFRGEKSSSDQAPGGAGEQTVSGPGILRGARRGRPAHQWFGCAASGFVAVRATARGK
jgi:hypothetical protein